MNNDYCVLVKELILSYHHKEINKNPEYTSATESPYINARLLDATQTPHIYLSIYLSVCMHIEHMYVCMYVYASACRGSCSFLYPAHYSANCLPYACIEHFLIAYQTLGLLL